jgi:hypothetical protein
MRSNRNGEKDGESGVNPPTERQGGKPAAAEAEDGGLRSQDLPRPAAQADGDPNRPASPSAPKRNGYGELNFHEELSPEGKKPAAANPGWVGDGPDAYGRAGQQAPPDDRPAGATRTDERVREKVGHALERDADLDHSAIEVQVEGGEVILDGVVPDRYARRLAEDLVEEQSGVRQVHNRLRVPDDAAAEGDGKPSRSA